MTHQHLLNKYFTLENGSIFLSGGHEGKTRVAEPIAIGKLLFLANLYGIDMTRDEAKALINRLQPFEPLSMEEHLLLSQSFQLPSSTGFLFLSYCPETTNRLKQRLSFDKCVLEAIKLGVTEAQAIYWLNGQIADEEQHQELLDRTYRTPEGS